MVRRGVDPVAPQLDATRTTVARCVAHQALARMVEPNEKSLENRRGPIGPSGVRIPPPPLESRNPRNEAASGSSFSSRDYRGVANLAEQSAATRVPWPPVYADHERTTQTTGPKLG